MIMGHQKYALDALLSVIKDWSAEEREYFLKELGLILTAAERKMLNDQI